MSVPVITLENIWKIYFYIAVFATILFVIKMIMFAIFVGDIEVSADFNTETDVDPSFNFISIQTVIAFFMGFGWMGYAGLHQFELGQLLNFIISFAVGLVFMFGTGYLMFLTKKLEKNVKKDKTTALNQVGKAYTSFEPNSTGQIEVDINGQLSVVNAKNATSDKINAFDAVKVVKVEDDLLYIEKV